jgi:hypothetical protein
MLDDTFNLLHVYRNWEHLRLRRPTITAYRVAQTEGENKSSILRDASIVLMITYISRSMYAYGVQKIMSLPNSISPIKAPNFEFSIDKISITRTSRSFTYEEDKGVIKTSC